MGMFDEIQCKVPLPAKKGLKTAAEWKNYTFQTKDLDNFLGHYEIRKSGLWVKEIKYKPTTKETPRGEKKKGNEWDKGWCFAPLEIESERWVKENFTGYICFYDFVHDADDAHDLWIEFGGHFDKGKLQGKIELNKWKEESSAERKADTKKWEEEAKARKKYEQKWRYKYCFKYWNKLVRFKFRILTRTLNWIHKIAGNLWKLERKITF